MEYKKKAPILKVSPRIREVSTTASGPTSLSHPITGDATTEEIRDRGRYNDKESMAREVQHQKETRERRGDDPGPKPTRKKQNLCPEIITKMTPNPAEWSESTASHIVRGCKKG